MDHRNAALTFIHDRALILGVEVHGDAVRLRAECSNGMPVDLVPAEAGDAADLIELSHDLIGCSMVFSGYLRVLESGALRVTALSVGIDPAMASSGRRKDTAHGVHP